MNKKTIAIVSFLSLSLLGCEVEDPPKRPVREFQDPITPPQDSRRSDSAPFPGRQENIEDGDRLPDALDEQADDAIKRFEKETRGLIDRRENG